MKFRRWPKKKHETIRVSVPTDIEVSWDGLPLEKMLPTTEAASRVVECLKNMVHEVNPDNFARLRAECENVMVNELPQTGEQRDALTKESMRYFVWAVRHVDEMKTKWKTVVAHDEEFVPASEAAYEVMTCLQKLSEGYVTPVSFPLLVTECTDVMTKNMPNTGEQRDALYKTAMDKFMKAEHYVDELKAKGNEKQETIQNKKSQSDVVGADGEKVVDTVVTDMPMIDDDGQNAAVEAMPMLDDDGQSLDSEAMPMLDDDGTNVETQATPTAKQPPMSEEDPSVRTPFQRPGTSQESQQENATVSESQPVDGAKVETPEEVEQRVQKQVLDEAAAKTTTAAPHAETEEEMRERIRAEVVRELGQKIKAEVEAQRAKA